MTIMGLGKLYGRKEADILYLKYASKDGLMLNGPKREPLGFIQYRIHAVCGYILIQQRLHKTFVSIC